MSVINVRGRMHAKPGAEAQLEAWMAKLIELIKAQDPGTIAFGFFRAADGVYLAVESYRDSDAALQHLDNIEPLLAELPELTDAGAHEPLEVFGRVSSELAKRYERFDAVYPQTVSATFV